MIPTRTVLIPVIEDGVRIGDMPAEASEQCITCRNWTQNMQCRAFLDVIPDAIWSGRHDHTTPFPGDGGILYDPDPRVRLEPAR